MPRPPSNPLGNFVPAAPQSKPTRRKVGWQPMALTDAAERAFPAMVRFDKLLPRNKRRWYILASGPHGLEPAKQIPSGATIVACNSAIQYGLKFSYWIGFDHRLPACQWWDKVKPSDECKRIFGVRLVNQLASFPAQLRIHSPDGYFEYLPELASYGVYRLKGGLKPGVLRGGLTVTGVALQMAVFGGATEVILVGVDFYGLGHFDGLHAGIPTCRREWPYCRAFEQFCALLETKHGCKVYIGSDSALKLPAWKWGAK